MKVCTTFSFIVLLLLSKFNQSTAAKILGVFGHVGKSHFDAFEPLMKALASRGHSITVVSHYPQKTATPNYTDIDVRESFTEANKANGIPFSRLQYLNQVVLSPLLTFFGNKMCDAVMSQPNVRNILKSEMSFDLVITEMFNTDCYLPFAHIYNAPHISMSSHVLMPWANSRFGNPDNPAYIPNLFGLMSTPSTLYDRLHNTLFYIYHNLVYFVTEAIFVGRTVSAHFGNAPSLEQLRKNTSLILVNTHFSMGDSRPLVPAVIEVGGIHIKPPRELPLDIDTFITEAKSGIIYFSLGSNIRASTMPEDKLQAFMDAFSELPQKVLWKWEDEELPNKTSKILIKKWMPQSDILAHPNVRAYISHCGNLGSIEAANFGVPVIGIPMYGDQFVNAKSLENKGMAVLIQYSDITKENILKALHLVLKDPRYQENAKRVSKAFNDRPMSPLDTAVYWTEYVIRHRGAPHLRSAAVDMPLYQYLLLDVIFLLLFITASVYYLLIKLLSMYKKAKMRTIKTKSN